MSRHTQVNHLDTYSICTNTKTATKTFLSSLSALVHLLLWCSLSFILLNLSWLSVLQCLLDSINCICSKCFSFDFGMNMEDKWKSYLALGWALYLSLFSSFVLEFFKGDLSSTSSLHLFLAGGGYNLSPWQNIKYWFSVCVHGVWVTGSVYVWVCFNMFVQPAVNDSFNLCVTVHARFYTCVCVCVFSVCVCVPQLW